MDNFGSGKAFGPEGIMFIGQQIILKSSFNGMSCPFCGRERNGIGVDRESGTLKYPIISFVCGLKIKLANIDILLGACAMFPNEIVLEGIYAKLVPITSNDECWVRLKQAKPLVLRAE